MAVHNRFTSQNGWLMCFSINYWGQYSLRIFSSRVFNTYPCNEVVQVSLCWGSCENQKDSNKIWDFFCVYSVYVLKPNEVVALSDGYFSFALSQLTNKTWLNISHISQMSHYKDMLVRCMPVVAFISCFHVFTLVFYALWWRLTLCQIHRKASPAYSLNQWVCAKPVIQTGMTQNLNRYILRYETLATSLDLQIPGRQQYRKHSLSK